MRRARGLRVSSPRDVCIFCASRQVAIGITYPSSSSAVQRRQLNSSSRAPQSAEAVLYKDDSPTPQPMTQAQRMRQALAASPTFTPPAQPRAGQMSQAERTRQSLAQQTPRQPPPPRQDTYASRRSLGGLGAGNRYGQSQRSDGFAPPRRQNDRSGNNDAFSDRGGTQSRYNVNMNSRPQLRTPAFNSAHLRRQKEPQGNAEPRRPTPVRTMLDQDEISKLLGNAASSDRPTKPYQPLARENNAQRKCWHCGSIDHMSNICPNKPTLRERTTDQGSEQRTMMWKPSASTQSSNQESLADAAQSWISQKARKFAVEPQPQARSAENDNRRDFDQERRRNRFEFNSPTNASNKFEGPEKRGRQNRGRRVQRFDEEEDERPTISKAERKRMKAEAKKAAQAARNEPTPISLPEYISVSNLASALKLRVEDFVRKLEELGFEDIQNDHILNAEHANLIAQEYNFEPTFQSEDDDGDLYAAPPVEPEVYAELPTRPPVVTIMGHVDHGKTTILDYMRSTSVAASEFGGITQHIGAFSVPLANGKKITFLDTPGHSAFETMRARGANVTDIVVLVVAADDSVKPQTVEAIKHAQAAKVPIIVAINKIDKAQADPEAVKLDLGGHGIEIEDFGGDVQVVCVSGKTGQGIPDLEEAISTLSEMLDHRADPEAAVEGWVLEGSTKNSGRVATVLVRSGTLRTGVNLVAGTTWAKIRSLRNEAGVEIEEVGPGMAVEVHGWRDQPIAGDEVLQAEDDQHASSVAELRTEKVERQQMAVDMEAINDFRRAEAHRRAEEEAAAKGEETAEVAEKESGPEVISFIIKGDVSGSVEAVIDSVSAIGNAEVSSRILRHGVGSPSEFDVSHAADARGHIINFNTPIPNHIAKMAEEKGVRILDSNIIYRVVENVKELMSEKLKPNVIKKVTGEAEIAAVFEIGLGGKRKLLIAGSKVRNGQVDRGSKCRVLRGESVVHEGSITSLKNVKKDVESMRKDTECGIGFEHWEEFKVGDRVQCYEEIFEKRTL